MPIAEALRRMVDCENLGLCEDACLDSDSVVILKDGLAQKLEALNSQIW